MTTALPHVSIVMPVRNEASFIKRSLGAVLAQSYPPEFLDMLVVDGGSEDGTRTQVQQLSLQHLDRSIKLLDNPDRYAPFAFNLGIQQASGAIVIIVGGHCEIAPDYVRCCVEVLEATGADCVGGPMHTVGTSLVARAIASAQSAPFGVGGVAFRTGREKGQYVDTVAFGAYRREVFDRIGGFDEELVRNQDDEFNFRLTQAGGKIWLDPSIRSVYYSRASLRKLWRQYFQYGIYKVRVIQKRRAIPSWRHLVPAGFIVALVASFLLAGLTGNGWWALAVVSPYLVANIAASLYAARQEERTLPVLPVAFFILHAAYGVGFLWGLWRWRAHFHTNPKVVPEF